MQGRRARPAVALCVVRIVCKGRRAEPARPSADAGIVFSGRGRPARDDVRWSRMVFKGRTARFAAPSTSR